MTGSMSRDIDLALIDPDPDQPRKRFDATEIDGLAESIAATGLAVPIMVRPDHDRFVIVHGERRWRACRQLGWKTIPANVTEIDAKAAWWLALVENIQRADLSPLEEAHAYRRSLATGVSQTDLGRRIGKSQSYIAHKLRLLTLPADVQAAVDDRRLSESHARQLLRLDGQGVDLSAVAERWITEQCSVKRAAARVDVTLMTSCAMAGGRVDYKFADLNALEKRLQPGTPEYEESLSLKTQAACGQILACWKEIFAAGFAHVVIGTEEWPLPALYDLARWMQKFESYGTVRDRLLVFLAPKAIEQEAWSQVKAALYGGTTTDATELYFRTVAEKHGLALGLEADLDEDED